MAMSVSTVRVELNARGGWTIDLPDEPDPVVCETFKDAQRVAYLCAAQRDPCELVVHDAYHRVLYRTLVSREGDAGVRSEAPGDGQPGAGEVDERHRVPVLRTGAN
jgi:hypothetical protein